MNTTPKHMFWRFKTPPPTLQVLYGGIPVAELKRISVDRQLLYNFRYLPAFAEANLAPLPGLPDVESVYWSEELWAFFAERIPDISRPEIAAMMKLRKINRYDDLQMLAELGGHAVTDPFEIRRVAA